MTEGAPVKPREKGMKGKKREGRERDQRGSEAVWKKPEPSCLTVVIAIKRKKT